MPPFLDDVGVVIQIIITESMHIQLFAVKIGAANDSL